MTSQSWPAAAAHFAARPPSSAWEGVPLTASTHYLWAWFKPPGLPDGLIVTIPDETWATYPERRELTMRRLLACVGLEPAAVSRWYLYGIPCESLGGTNPLLDQPIPPPAPGADPRIAISVQPVCVPGRVAAAPAPVAAQFPAAASQSMAAGPNVPLFTRIESDWNAILQIEANLVLLRKQLGGMLNRINALNRDLSPDERQYGERKDKSDWQIARRWLRDVAAKLSRCIKDHDLGHTSSAGKRNQFEQTYQTWIAPRLPCEGLDRVQRDFEQHRKTVQMLLNNMQAAYTNAAQDGERRAQEILNRIAAKVRTARTRR
jgi:hypothetical protein